MNHDEFGITNIDDMVEMIKYCIHETTCYNISAKEEKQNEQIYTVLDDIVKVYKDHLTTK